MAHTSGPQPKQKIRTTPKPLETCIWEATKEEQERLVWEAKLARVQAQQKQTSLTSTQDPELVRQTLVSATERSVSEAQQEATPEVPVPLDFLYELKMLEPMSQLHKVSRPTLREHRLAESK